MSSETEEQIGCYVWVYTIRVAGNNSGIEIEKRFVVTNVAETGELRWGIEVSLDELDRLLAHEIPVTPLVTALNGKTYYCLNLVDLATWEVEEGGGSQVFQSLLQIVQEKHKARVALEDWDVDVAAIDWERVHDEGSGD